MSNRDKDYFKRLFLRLKNKYDKTFIIITKDVTFLFDIVDKVTVINKGNIILSEGKEIFYNSNLYRFINMPKIIEFTRYAESEGHDIKKCLDIKELIKELYRNVR